MTPRSCNTALKIAATIVAVGLVNINHTAADATPPVQAITTQEAFGPEIWQRLKQYYYQTLFDSLGDLNQSIYSNNFLNIHLQEGRLIISQDPLHVMLADHFGLNVQGAVPVGSLLSFGGNVGAYLLRIRQVPTAKDGLNSVTLKQDLADWDPKQKLDDPSTFQNNISPWIDEIAADVRAGQLDGARQIFSGEIPEEQYLDLLAGLKLPFEMPWTSKRLLNNKKFLLGDLMSFVAQGGIFARLGGQGIGWQNIAGPWVGIFLNGQFRFGVFKMTDQKFLLRVDSEKSSGWNYNAFDDDFRIPLGHGVIFGHDIHPSTGYRPFSITGISYNAKLFARTYQLDFSFPDVAKAYDAAIHGNLTVLDDLAKEGEKGVEVLSERYNNGLYNQSQFEFHFGPIQFDNVYSSSNVKEDFWDKRGTFEYFNANSLRTSYVDVNLLAWAVRQSRTNTLAAEAYPVAPDGPFPPRLTWSFDEVNASASADERKDLQTFIESLKPTANALAIARSKYQKFHAAFQLQVHPAGVDEFENHTVDDIWRDGGRVVYNDATIWQNLKARNSWLDAHPDNNDDVATYYQVDHWAQMFAKKPQTGEIQKWFGNLIVWQRATYWDALGVRLFLGLVQPEHRYLKLVFTSGDGPDQTIYEDGTLDITAYPDDWEYLTIPDIRPQVPPPQT